MNRPADRGASHREIHVAATGQGRAVAAAARGRWEVSAIAGFLGGPNGFFRALGTEGDKDGFNGHGVQKYDDDRDQSEGQGAGHRAG